MQFQPISQRTALRIEEHYLNHLANVERIVLEGGKDIRAQLYEHVHQDEAYSSRLHQKPEPRSERDHFSLRQVSLLTQSMTFHKLMDRT